MKSKNSWIFLSYTLSNKLSGYGNGKRIHIDKVKSQSNGDSSNNTEISLPSHSGTHIDFPMHFSLNGKSINNYTAGDFIFKSIEIVDLSKKGLSDYLIKVADLEKIIIRKNKKTDFIIIKTGFCEIRENREYWEKGLGFDLGTAKYLKSNYPNLKAIGFDSMSLSSFQQREIGRIAHKEFLIENDILIIEDMDLISISEESIINEIIVSPLRFENAEGTPVTVLAKIKND